MKVTTLRFGEIEVQEEVMIELPAGMIGFPAETRYIWIPHKNSRDIGWLQSTSSAHIAFPLVNAESVGDGYPELAVSSIAELGGVGYEEPSQLALLVVLTASPTAPPLVNLMAPVVINSVTRFGAQVVLAGSRYTTATWTRRATSAPIAVGAP